MLTLTNKVIVVIGGTTGIGFSAAKACIQAGARCVIVGRNSDSLSDALEQLGRNSAGLPADAARPETAGAAIDLAVKLFGNFHGLYHVAGGSGRKFGDGPLHELTDDGIQRTLELNLNSVLYSNRAAVRQFQRQKTGGTIVNLSSVLGFAPEPKNFATHTYAAAKAGIIGLTKSAAAYYAAQNIRFNVLAPALVDTPMAKRAVENEQITEFIRTKQPLDGGRVGVPQDLDAATVWLLSEESKFVTGQVIAIDGGWSVS